MNKIVKYDDLILSVTKDEITAYYKGVSFSKKGDFLESMIRLDNPKLREETKQGLRAYIFGLIGGVVLEIFTAVNGVKFTFDDFINIEDL